MYEEYLAYMILGVTAMFIQSLNLLSDYFKLLGDVEL